MKRNRFFHYIFLSLFLMMTNCSKPKEILLSTIESEPQRTRVVEPIVTPLKNGVSTIRPPTMVNTPSPDVTPQKSNVPSLVKRCATLESFPSDNPISSGSILFYSNERSPNDILLLSNGVLEPKPYFPYYTFFAASPYSGTVAWLDKKESYRYVHFRRLDGREAVSELADNALPLIRQWVEGDQAIFDSENTYLNGGPNSAFDEFYLASPDDSSAHLYKLSFFGYFYGHSTNQSPGGEGIMRYSPDLSKVIYGWGDSKMNDKGILLWDIKSEKVIWKKGNWGWPADKTLPDWQSDGSHVAITAPIKPRDLPPEIFSISGNGEESRLTFLSTVINEPYMIFDLLWSPDNRYIAFIFNKDILEPYINRELYIVDTETKIATDYCLPTPVRKMVWSPDSKQIAFLVNDEALYILDIYSGKAQFLDNVRTLYGWIPD